MVVTQTIERPAATRPFRFFMTEVRRIVRLGPSFVRVTLTGDDLDRFADTGYDQRIKLITSLPGHGFADLPTGDNWYEAWRCLPDERRNPIRTYTVRAVRAAAREVDVDMVLHGATGPASRWAVEARPGTPLCLLGPNADHDGERGGVDFRPPAHADKLLLVGDETAVPAIASILSRLAPDAVGEAVLEVPESGDRLEITAPAGFRVTWLPRDGAGHGEKLIPEVRRAVQRVCGGRPAPSAASPLEDVDVDHDVLWEVPEPLTDTASFYAWLAGEAGVIKTLRRHLVAECGIDRRAVAFMGYWRQGRAEGS